MGTGQTVWAICPRMADNLSGSAPSAGKSPGIPGAEALARDLSELFRAGNAREHYLRSRSIKNFSGKIGIVFSGERVELFFSTGSSGYSCCRRYFSSPRQADPGGRALCHSRPALERAERQGAGPGGTGAANAVRSRRRPEPDGRHGLFDRVLDLDRPELQDQPGRRLRTLQRTLFLLADAAGG
jgi:hypothetical protein